MKNLLIISALAVSACAMNAKTIQDNCYHHAQFDKVSKCINQELSTASTIPRNRSAFEQYGLFAQALAVEVKKGKYTNDEAKMILANQRIKLEQADEEKFRNAMSMIGGNNKNGNDAFTNCHLVGNTVSCHSF